MSNEMAYKWRKNESSLLIQKECRWGQSGAKVGPNEPKMSHKTTNDAKT
jgi:hypothetical protein